MRRCRSGLVSNRVPYYFKLEVPKYVAGFHCIQSYFLKIFLLAYFLVFNPRMVGVGEWKKLGMTWLTIEALLPCDLEVPKYRVILSKHTSTCCGTKKT